MGFEEFASSLGVSHRLSLCCPCGFFFLLLLFLRSFRFFLLLFLLSLLVCLVQDQSHLGLRRERRNAAFFELGSSEAVLGHLRYFALFKQRGQLLQLQGRRLKHSVLGLGLFRFSLGARRRCLARLFRFFCLVFKDPSEMLLKLRPQLHCLSDAELLHVSLKLAVRQTQPEQKLQDVDNAFVLATHVLDYEALI